MLLLKARAANNNSDSDNHNTHPLNNNEMAGRAPSYHNRISNTPCNTTDSSGNEITPPAARLTIKGTTNNVMDHQKSEPLTLANHFEIESPLQELHAERYKFDHHHQQHGNVNNGIISGQLQGVIEETALTTAATASTTTSQYTSAITTTSGIYYAPNRSYNVDHIGDGSRQVVDMSMVSAQSQLVPNCSADYLPPIVSSHYYTSAAGQHHTIVQQLSDAQSQSRGEPLLTELGPTIEQQSAASHSPYHATTNQIQHAVDDVGWC